MMISVVAGGPTGQLCCDCAVRQFNVCAALDKTERQELERLGRHARFSSGKTVFAQEEVMTSVYNVLEGVMRLYKLLPDGRRQIVGFALPGDFLGMAPARHGFSADAIGQVDVCKFAKTSFARFAENRPHLLRRINELAVRELSDARDHMVLLGRRSDYLGLTIETVSRTFTKFERDGMIKILPGSVCLLDLARAEALAAA